MIMTTKFVFLCKSILAGVSYFNILSLYILVSSQIKGMCYLRNLQYKENNTLDSMDSSIWRGLLLLSIFVFDHSLNE